MDAYIFIRHVLTSNGGLVSGGMPKQSCTVGTLDVTGNLLAARLFLYPPH